MKIVQLQEEIRRLKEAVLVAPATVAELKAEIELLKADVKALKEKSPK